MKTIPQTALAVGLAIVLIAAASPLVRLQFSPEESTMSISGTSTIHDWTCEVEAVNGWAEVEAGAFTAGAVTVKVEDIECGKRIMNRKLRDALKGDDHPEITFTPSAFEAADGAWTAQGTLDVAGASQDVTVGFSSSDADPQHITGSVELSLEALGVDRPTAVMGTIKTGDLITITFDVSARASS